MPGLTGIAQGVSPAMLAIARQRLIGADPLDVQQLAVGLYSLAGGFSPTFGGANIEIALWDLAGKVLEIPLYRLWGGRDGKLMPYASQWTTGTPDERGAHGTDRAGKELARDQVQGPFPDHQRRRRGGRADAQGNGQ